jgi:hypothetical protein
MSALVPELVNMASTPSISTTDLLRKSLVVARRLAAPVLTEWINSELTGYKVGEIPDYRRLRGQLMAFNPQHGYIPFFPPVEMVEMLADFPAHQSIPELIHLKSSDTGIYSHFPPDIEQTLMQMMRKSPGVAMRPALKFSTVQIEGIIEAVRSRILDWALDLECRGIFGDGMSFTTQEKQAVSEKHYHFGNITGSQIQISTSESSQTQTTKSVDIEALKGLIGALSNVLDSGFASKEVADELRAELDTLRAQTTSPKPKWEIIKATARSIKAIVEAAAGNILGEIAKPHALTLLALASS